MKSLIVLLIVTLAAVQGRDLLATTEEAGKPDSPPYKVVNSTDSLELREYANATFAVAFGRSRWSIDLASYYAGAALFKYFKGGNVAHATIKPTIPLIATLVKPPPHKHGDHHNHSMNGTRPGPPHKPHGPRGPPAVALAAYLPEKFQGEAPIPDCPHVKIVQTNTTDVYVHRFGGWAFSFVVKHEIGHLRRALKDIEICPKKGKFFLATYSGPWKIFGRRNEIMWTKRPKHQHHNETTANTLDFTLDGGVRGFETFSVEKLFPEEFEIKELPFDEPEDDKDALEFLS